MWSKVQLVSCHISALDNVRITKSQWVHSPMYFHWQVEESFSNYLPQWTGPDKNAKREQNKTKNPEQQKYPGFESNLADRYIRKKRNNKHGWWYGWVGKAIGYL